MRANPTRKSDGGLGTGLLVAIFLVLAVLAIAALILFGFARTAVAW
jgi:hypothetical protein